MIADIFSIDEKMLRNFFKKPFNIYEKLDMYYFKVYMFSDICIPVFARTGKAISYEDTILNSLFDDIVEFVKTKIDIPELRNKFYSKYGFSKIGFLYYPGQVNNHTFYPNIKNKTFVLSDIWTSKSPESLNLNLIYFTSIYSSAMDEHFLDIPLIRKVAPNEIDDVLIDELLKRKNDREEAYEYLMQNFCFKSWSKNSGIDGIIFRSKDKTLQFNLLSSEIQKLKEKSDDTYNTIKRMWRELLLLNFIQATAPSIDKLKTKLKTSSKTYISNVCDIFVEFIDHADIFAKYSCEDDDFLPSWDKWLLDFNINKIPNETAKTICQFNPIGKSVLRFLIHCLRRHYTYEELKNLNTDTVDKLNEIVDALNYHNYSEIALAQLKVQEQVK